MTVSKMWFLQVENTKKEKYVNKTEMLLCENLWLRLNNIIHSIGGTIEPYEQVLLISQNYNDPSTQYTLLYSSSRNNDLWIKYQVKHHPLTGADKLY